VTQIPSVVFPRLATSVVARRYVSDGASRVVLFDSSADDVLSIRDREWEIIAAADGTRDLAGIAIAAGRQGVRVTPQEVGRLIGQLAQRGMMVATPEPSPPPVAPVPPEDRPVVPMPGYGLRCDRSGGCCRMYSTVLFSPADAERARALLPARTFGPMTPERAFLPVRGSVPGGGVAMTLLDGACGYLDGDGGCTIHAAAGAEAKPTGCHVYPAIFIDDGAEVRVAIKTECACVLDSAGRPGGEPLVQPAVQRAEQLPTTTVVSRLRARLQITAIATIDRATARQWADRWFHSDAPPDPAGACWAMADGLPEDPTTRWTGGAPVPSVDAVRPYVQALARRASARARVDARWRSESDRVRRIGDWVATAATELADATLLTQVLAGLPQDPAREGFYVRAAAYGYLPFDENLQTLHNGLRDLAVRLWLSRHMAAVATEPVAAEDALTTLEAWLRAYGCWRYILDPSARLSEGS